MELRGRYGVIKSGFYQNHLFGPRGLSLICIFIECNGVVLELCYRRANWDRAHRFKNLESSHHDRGRSHLLVPDKYCVPCVLREFDMTLDLRQIGIDS